MRNDGIETRGRPALYCDGCGTIHRHSGGSLYCSKYAFKVVDGMARPSFCRNRTKRVGSIPKAALVKPDVIPTTCTEWGNLRSEQETQA